MHDNKLDNYDQYDIQYAQRYSRYDDPDYSLTESDYVYYDPVFEPISAIEKIIGGKCYRLRYSYSRARCNSRLAYGST